MLIAKCCYSTGFIHTTVSELSGNVCLPSGNTTLIFFDSTQHTDLNMAFYSQMYSVTSADALLLSFLFLVILEIREDIGLCLLQMPTTSQ